MRPFAALAAAYLAAAPASAGSPGSTSFDFLKLGASPRQAAMGESGVALWDEEGGAYLNPASLAGMAAPRAAFSYNRLFDDIQHGQLGYAQPLEGRGAVEGELEYLDYGSIPGADATGGRTGAVNASDQLLKLSWAAPGESFAPGISLKAARETLDGVLGTALAMDLGAVWRPPRDWEGDSFWGRQASRLSLGAALRNVGPPARFESEKEPLPLTVAIGAAHRSFADQLTFSLDLEKASDRPQGAAAHFGVEAWVKDAVALRLGLRSDQDAGFGASFGVGVKAGAATLDYAMRPFGALGIVHRVGVSLRFGGGLVESYYEQGLKALREGDSAQAVLFFDKALALDPKNRRVIEKALEASRALEREGAGAKERYGR